ncbi:aldo/keto reductase [bacterium]|nr:aldo/keto reductase [bacterium]
MTISIELTSGRQLPAVGMGFWKVGRDVAADVTTQAIECGYRHLDCACDYGNETEVGHGIAAAVKSGLVTREQLWVTSKLWNTYHRPEHVRAACERSLRDLQLEYLDLYLIHFPIALQFVPFEDRYPPEWFFDPDAFQPQLEPDRVPIHETWQAMEELVAACLVREIGVCNFGVSLLRDLLACAKIPPAVLQVELHPYLTQEKLLRFCRESGIAVTGFSPLGAQSYFALNMAQQDESVLESEPVRRIAAAHDRTPAQVVLRWAVQRGTAVVPKTSRVERMRENLSINDFSLTDDEMAAISALNRNRRFNDPGDFCEAAFNTFFPIYE